jgi:hypothetical protein
MTSRRSRGSSARSNRSSSAGSVRLR